MNYQESYNILVNHVNELLQMHNNSLLEIVKNIHKKDLLSAYDKLLPCINEIGAYQNKLIVLVSALRALMELGKPLPELQMNKAVKCSYTEPQEHTTCSYCANACKLTNEDMDFILCNICNQAVNAKTEGYSDEQIMDAYTVHPDGHCKQHVPASEIPYIEDLVNTETTDEEETPIVPPEAPYGFVEENEMEPNPVHP